MNQKMNVKFDHDNAKISTKVVSYKSILEQAMSLSYLAIGHYGQKCIYLKTSLSNLIYNHYFRKGSHYVAQAAFKFVILPWYWEYNHKLPHFP